MNQIIPPAATFAREAAPAIDLPRRLAAEMLGTALLLAIATVRA